MARSDSSKRERIKRLQQMITEKPMATDDEIAEALGVSIYTIRADRQKLGIPDARQRTKDMASGLFGKAKSLSEQEIVGELLDVQLNKEGLSLLETQSDMGFKRSDLVRGHTLFAQANSLAVAIVDADVVLTGEAHIRFISPVRVGEKVLGKAQVVSEDGRKKMIEVVLKTKERLVFEGQFSVYGLTKELAAHLKILEECQY